jgi:hypothetical protein
MSAVQGGPNFTLEICSENSIGYLHLSPGSDSTVNICLSLCEANALSSINKLFYCLLFTVDTNQTNVLDWSMTIKDYKDKDQAAGLELAELLILCGHQATGLTSRV